MLIEVGIDYTSAGAEFTSPVHAKVRKIDQIDALVMRFQRKFRGVPQPGSRLCGYRS